MEVKEQYEIIVFPKIFTIMNFYSKGLYNLEISLTAQQQLTGAIVKAFPSLVQGPDAVKSEDKRAKIHTKDSHMVYSSENFYVTFSAQNVYFNTLPCFKLELERHKRYKVCVEVKLILTQFRISKNNSTKEVPRVSGNGNYLALGSIDSKIMAVDSRKLYLNNLGELNTYQRVIFSEPDYFSYTDVYLFGMRTGTCVRPHALSLVDFHQSPIEERSKLHLAKPEELKWLISGLTLGSSVQLRGLFKSEGVVGFYREMVEKTVGEYKRLAYLYQHFRAMMMALNNSTIVEKVAIPYLDDMSKLGQSFGTGRSEIEMKALIQEYYQSESETEIYVEILHVFYFISQEAELISRNKKWLLSELCKLLVKINYNVFELLSSPVVRQNMQNKQRHLIFHGNIQKDKQRMHNQFLLQRHHYCQANSIVEEIDLKHPFIMLEDYTDHIPQNIKKEGVPPYVIDNLVVFVHGYQGSDFDLELAKYNLEMYNTHTYCLMSASIQDEMDEPIEYLGMQLATQIKEHTKHSYNSYKRISFVGYSLGGILVREAMKHLEQFKDKMNVFMSLASPHAGTMDGGNVLIKTGIWYLINFQNAKNLKQLHCQFEGKEQENFALKKLSQCETLEWFKKFVVASSQQDSFVPYGSSRVDALQGSQITRIMCENIRKRVKRLERVQVWFDVASETGAIDKMLGRKAHIQFLENKVFLHALFKLYAGQF